FIFLLVLVSACSNGDTDISTNAESSDTNNENASNKEDATTLIAYSKWPDDNHISNSMRLFSERIEEETDGQLIIDVKTGGALGFEGPEILKAVKDNLVPIATSYVSDSEGEIPLLGIVNLPFIIGDADESKIFHELLR